MDSFELLGLPRQAWLDPAAIRAAFQERARVLHPDAAAGDEAAFARLNAACQELGIVSRRLRLLAAGAEAPAVPWDPALGFEIAGLLPAVDAELAAGNAPGNPLLTVLRAQRRRDLATRVAALLAGVARRREQAEAELRRLAPGEAAALAGMATEFAYLERWEEQLRRRELELRILAG